MAEVTLLPTLSPTEHSSMHAAFSDPPHVHNGSDSWDMQKRDVRIGNVRVKSVPKYTTHLGSSNTEGGTQSMLPYACGQITDHL